MTVKKALRALKTAFPFTLPILAGFLFLGISYGILARTSGLPAWLPILTSTIIFGGSLEFVGITILTSPFAPVQAFIMGIMVQARHLFYGLSMLDKYKGAKASKPYLIFGLCDETFSINCSAVPKEGVDRNLFMLFVTALNQLYWVVGATLGSLVGSVFTFNTEGLDFAMTAMFTVILLEQLLKEKSHISSSIGLLSTVLCLLVFGKDSFLIPSMIVILTLLLLFKKPIEQGGDIE